MKDTVTYPLSAITGDEEESRIDQLERELVAARAEVVRLKGEAVAKERKSVPEFELIERELKKSKKKA